MHTDSTILSLSEKCTNKRHKYTPMHTYVLFFRFENKLSDLLSWIKTCKLSTQALASTHPETTSDTPDLQEKLKVDL